MIRIIIDDELYKSVEHNGNDINTLLKSSEIKDWILWRKPLKCK